MPRHQQVRIPEPVKRRDPIHRRPIRLRYPHQRLTRLDAEAMIDELRSSRLLTGLRGAPPADRQALVDVILRIGQLAVDCPEITEMDINPLVVLPEGKGALAVDARIILAQP